MAAIRPEETMIVGSWVVEDGQVRDDAASRRIRQLVSAHLVELGRDPSGWETLYRDTTDGRLWELTYPQGEMQGGGPPLLRVVSAAESRAKYPGLPAG